MSTSRASEMPPSEVKAAWAKAVARPEAKPQTADEIAQQAKVADAWKRAIKGGSTPQER